MYPVKQLEKAVGNTRITNINDLDRAGTGWRDMQIANDQVGEDAAFESQVDVQMRAGREMAGQSLAQRQEKRAMKGHKQDEKSAESNACSTTPSSGQEPVCIFSHE